MLVWHLQYSNIRMTFTLLLTERFGIKNCGKTWFVDAGRPFGNLRGGKFMFCYFCALARLL